MGTRWRRAGPGSPTTRRPSTSPWDNTVHPETKLDGNEWGANEAVEVSVQAVRKGKAAPISVVRVTGNGFSQYRTTRTRTRTPRRWTRPASPSSIHSEPGGAGPPSSASRSGDAPTWNPAADARVAFNLTVRKTHDDLWLMWEARAAILRRGPGRAHRVRALRGGQGCRADAVRGTFAARSRGPSGPVAGILLMALSAANATEYFVAKNGKDGERRPVRGRRLCTIQKGRSALKPGMSSQYSPERYLNPSPPGFPASRARPSHPRQSAPGTVLLRGDVGCPGVPARGGLAPSPIARTFAPRVEGIASAAHSACMNRLLTLPRWR